LMQP